MLRGVDRLMAEQTLVPMGRVSDLDAARPVLCLERSGADCEWNVALRKHDAVRRIVASRLAGIDVRRRRSGLRHKSLSQEQRRRMSDEAVGQ